MQVGQLHVYAPLSEWLLLTHINHVMNKKLQSIIEARGAIKYEVDTGVRPALQQSGAFGESTGSKNEGSLGESMIFGIQWEKNTKICGVIGWEPKVHKKVGSLGGT